MAQLDHLAARFSSGSQIEPATARVAAAPRSRLARDGNFCLIPFDRREGITTVEAAERAARTERTIRMWCRDHEIGRRVAGGPWLVSRVALAMLLNDDAVALRAYLSGERGAPVVTDYFAMEGIGDLIERWESRPR